MEFTGLDEKTLKAILAAEPTDEVLKGILAAIEKGKMSPECKGAFAAASKIAGSHLSEAKKAKLAKLFSDDDDDDDDDAEKSAIAAKKSADILAEQKARLAAAAPKNEFGIDLEAVEKSARPVVELLMGKMSEIQKEFRAERDKNRLAETTARVRKEYAGLPINADDFAQVMVKIEKGERLDENEVAYLDLVLKAAASTNAHSKLFESMSVGNEDGMTEGMSATQEIETRANELVAKSGVGKDGKPVLDYAHAITKVATDNPGLYARAEIEHNAADNRS